MAIAGTIIRKMKMRLPIILKACSHCSCSFFLSGGIDGVHCGLEMCGRTADKRIMP